MIEKGHGEVTFGSEGIRPKEYIERKKGELEMGIWGSSSTSTEMLRRGRTGWVGKENEEEKGQMEGDRVLSRHLAEAKRDEEEKRECGEQAKAGTWRRRRRRSNMRKRKRKKRDCRARQEGGRSCDASSNGEVGGQIRRIMWRKSGGGSTGETEGR